MTKHSGKMKDGTEVVPVVELVQLKSEIYSSIKEYDIEDKKAKMN